MKQFSGEMTLIKIIYLQEEVIMAQDNQKKNLVTLLIEHFNQKVYPVYRGKATEYLLVKDGNFNFYQAKKKKQGTINVLDEVRLVASYPIKEIGHATIDYYALSVRHFYDNGLSVSFLNKEKELEDLLEKYGVTISIKKRKWFNKILGFRSKKIWKMAIATISYPIIFILLFGSFLDFLEEEKKMRQEQAIAQEERAMEKEARKEANELKKQQEADAVTAFKEDGNQKMMYEFDGIVLDVEMEENPMLSFDVFVDEFTWAGYTKSEKRSLYATLRAYFRNELDQDFGVVIYSEQNQDILARGTKIYR